MYSILATDDFVGLIKELPLRCTAALTNSFLSIKKVEEVKEENTFINDLLEQIKNQELE